MKWVALEGVMGSGKTTTAKLIHTMLTDQGHDCDCMIERALQNPFIEEMYKTLATPNPDQDVILSAEIVFSLLENQACRQGLNGSSDIIISDFSPHKTIMFSAMNLGKSDDYTTFMHINRRLNAKYMPDLVVYIDLPVEVNLQRMASRGRPFEQNTKLQYLLTLDKMYHSALHQLGKDCEVIRLPGDETEIQVAELIIDVMKEYRIL